MHVEASVRSFLKTQSIGNATFLSPFHSANRRLSRLCISFSVVGGDQRPLAAIDFPNPWRTCFARRAGLWSAKAFSDANARKQYGRWLSGMLAVQVLVKRRVLLWQMSLDHEKD